MIDQGYRVVVMEGSSNEDKLKGAPAGTPMHTVYHELMANDPESFVPDDATGVREILSSSKMLLFASDTKVAGVNGVQALDIVDSSRGQISWALRKGSEFAEMFSHHLEKMDEQGIWRKIFEVNNQNTYIRISESND